MFGRIKDLLDQALDSLEARFDAVGGDHVDRLIGAMRDELVETKARLPELEALLASTVQRADREKAEAEACERRASQAAAIGDEETREIAERFAATHRKRLEVLVMKAETTRAEILQHRAEVAEMTGQLKQAMARRDSLGVQQRRARAIENTTSRLDSVEAFDRVAETLEGASDVDRARRDLDLELDPDADAGLRDVSADRSKREADAEALLRELKRRMGVEDEGPDAS